MLLQWHFLYSPKCKFVLSDKWKIFEIFSTFSDCSKYTKYSYQSYPVNYSFIYKYSRNCKLYTIFVCLHTNISNINSWINGKLTVIVKVGGGGEKKTCNLDW